MRLMKPEDISKFLERFYSGNHGVVKEINCHSLNGELPVITLRIQFMDKEIDAAYVDVIIKMEGVDRFRMENDKTSSLYMQEGMSIAWIDNQYYFGFDTDWAQTKEDFYSAEMFFVGKNFWWDVKRI